MSDEFKVQWSVSLPPVAQYAKGHMLNIRAETVVELSELVEDLNDEVLTALADVAANLVALSTVAESLGAKSVSHEESATTSRKSSERKSSGGGTVSHLRTCEHGKRTRRTGTGRKGDWVGYFCPLEKGDPDQCDPVWED